MMIQVQTVCEYLDRIAPPHLAEDWDNVGLLVGDRRRPVQQVMTCLTVTPDSAAEAADAQADLVVTHHPLPFRPLKRLTADELTGRLLLELISAGVSVYSAHTAFDSALEGINQQLAEGLGLTNIRPLLMQEGDMQDGAVELGAGRYGMLPNALNLENVAQKLKQFLGIEAVQAVGEPDRPVQQAAVACGSAGQFLEPARAAGCDLLVTGETSFHTCLAAEAAGVALLLPGHYASERFAVETLADRLAEQFPGLNVWASEREADPLWWI